MKGTPDQISSALQAMADGCWDKQTVAALFGPACGPEKEKARQFHTTERANEQNNHNHHITELTKKQTGGKHGKF